MSEQETVFYRDDKGVQVTNSRAVIKGKTYSMANITSVNHVNASGKLLWPIIIFLMGLGSFLIGFADEALSCAIWPGAIVCLAVIVWFVFFRTKYAVVVGSASGETQALVSRDKAYTGKIAEAISEAIVKRG